MTQQHQQLFQTNEYSTEVFRTSPNDVQLLDKQYFFKEPSQHIMFNIVSPDSQNQLFYEQFELKMKHSAIKQFDFIKLISLQQPSQQLFNQPQSEFSQEEIKQTARKTKKIKKALKKQGLVKKPLAKSQITKNACCNIVQKTISLIKSRQYEYKLSQICLQQEVQISAFKKFIINQKIRFTGTKALQLFLSQKHVYHTVFARFLKWFLKQKYIRHALMQGQMNNLQAYIQFKNSVILPLL